MNKRSVKLIAVLKDYMLMSMMVFIIPLLVGWIEGNKGLFEASLMLFGVSVVCWSVLEGVFWKE